MKRLVTGMCALLVAAGPLACTRSGNEEQPGRSRPGRAPSGQPTSWGGGPNWGAGSEHMGVGDESVRVGGPSTAPGAAAVNAAPREPRSVDERATSGGRATAREAPAGASAAWDAGAAAR